ncbi:hypothetical protein GBAR_LOCUS25743 [Geodia barretti]|uniref:Uncharacterized protein n=1 Tax=Geodia barretti TaxID=519541 RepID=A0AA35TEK3_GEOBA|nr:hypothetical protein GBAR_LOCUS25743 [Geodia barretti]
MTFDLATSSRGNRSRSERRGSQQVAFETGSHDNLAHSDGSHGNHQTLTNRPLTPGGCVTEGGVEEVESKGGEGCGSEVCEMEVEGEGEEGEGERDGEPGAQQSELVYQWYRQLCVLLWVMDGLKLDSLSLLSPFAKCWQLDRGGVQRIHSQAVSRGHTPSRNQQRYNLWKDNSFPQTTDGSPPKSGTAEFNPLSAPRNGHMTSESLTPSAYRRLKREAASREEQRMRQQKRLTVRYVYTIHTLDYNNVQLNLCSERAPLNKGHFQCPQSVSYSEVALYGISFRQHRWRHW